MTVLDFANISLFNEMRNNDLLHIRQQMRDGNDDDLARKISSSDDTIKYWSAYIDGVKAQLREANSDK